jgi:hypothetical protein
MFTNWGSVLEKEEHLIMKWEWRKHLMKTRLESLDPGGKNFVDTRKYRRKLKLRDVVLVRSILGGGRCRSDAKLSIRMCEWNNNFQGLKCVNIHLKWLEIIKLRANSLHPTNGAGFSYLIYYDKVLGWKAYVNCNVDIVMKNFCESTV